MKDIQAVALFKEVDAGEWRVSMRSKGAVDVGAIARWFGGGGHKNAAGCSASGELDALQRRSSPAGQRSGSERAERAALIVSHA